MAATGATIGLAVAYSAARLVSSWLYEVRPFDPLILSSALAIVLGVTVVATVLPVRKASRIDPTFCLRFE